MTAPVRLAAGAVTPAKITFDLQPQTKAAIEAASARVAKQISECDLKVNSHYLLGHRELVDVDVDVCVASFSPCRCTSRTA